MSRPHVLVPASEQQAAKVSGGAPGIASVSLAHIFVPQATGPVSTAPPWPATLPSPAVPPLPPFAVVGPESEELPHAGTATAATRAPAQSKRTARKNMAAQCFTLAQLMRVLPAAAPELRAMLGKELNCE